MLPSVRLSAADILECTAGGEGTRLEFKRVLPRDERAARTLCAFANTRGGLLLVGVTDRGRIHGVHRPESVSDRLSSLAEERVDPPLSVELQIVAVAGPRVVACSVPFSRARPHAVLLADDEREIVVRVGASNRIADGPTLQALSRAVVAGGGARRGKDPLERRILAWIARNGSDRSRPAGSATVGAFARASNVGEARARRAFVDLEHRGLLVGHGTGRARVYAAP
jgi:hypothetical protein